MMLLENKDVYPFWTLLHVGGSPRKIDQASSQHVNLDELYSLLFSVDVAWIVKIDTKHVGCSIKCCRS